MNRGQKLEYSTFRTAGFTTSFSIPSGNEVYIEKIEIVPANSTFEAEIDVEEVKKHWLTYLHVQEMA